MRRHLDDTVDQRGQEHARRDAVTETIGAGEKRVHFVRAHMDLGPAGFDCLRDAIASRGSSAASSAILAPDCSTRRMTSAGAMPVRR
jgi:hypothetical protein